MSNTSDSEKEESIGSKDQTEQSSAPEVQGKNSEEAIEVDFDELDSPDTTPLEVRETTEKTGPGWGALMTTGAFSSIIGAVIAMVATGSSGVDTAKFAPAEVKNQIIKVESLQNGLNERVQKFWGSLTELEAKQTSAISDLNAILDERLQSELEIRDEIALITSHLEIILSDGRANTLPATAEAENSGAANLTNEDTSDPNLAAVTSPPPSRVQALTSLIARMDSLEELQTNSGGGAPPSGEMAEFKDRLEKVEAAEANLRQAMQARSEAIRSLTISLTQTQKTIKGVETDIENLQSFNSQPISKNIQPQSIDKSEQNLALASIAIAEVEAKSSRGKPFFQSWDKLSETMPANDDIEAIKEISRYGAPSLDELSSSFFEMEKSLIKEATSSNKKDGWDWARNALGGVVTVKRTEGENIDNAGRLKNIADALNASKLDIVVANANGIEGPLSNELEDWTLNAQRRLTLDQSLSALKTEILEKSGAIISLPAEAGAEIESPTTDQENTQQESQ